MRDMTCPNCRTVVKSEFHVAQCSHPDCREWMCHSCGKEPKAQRHYYFPVHKDFTIQDYYSID